MQHEVFIGDNSYVLDSDKLAHLHGQVSVIYLDPPYNTCNKKLSYPDTFTYDEWRNLIHTSLKAASKFLREDGVLFISIDDKMLPVLRSYADERFEFLGTFIWHQAQRSNSKHINVGHEYVLCYAKDKSKVPAFKVKRKDTREGSGLIHELSNEVHRVFDEYQQRYGSIDNQYACSQGIKAAESVLRASLGIKTLGGENSWLRNYNRVDEQGRIFYPKDLSVPGKPAPRYLPWLDKTLPALPTRAWASAEHMKKLDDDGRLYWRDDRPYAKHYLWEAEDSAPSILPFYSPQGTEDLKRIGLGGLFTNPKPVELIKYLIRLVCPNDGVVMDWFAGSGTTGQAVLELNALEDYRSKFVLSDINEEFLLKRLNCLLEKQGRLFETFSVDREFYNGT